jgi:hypothetical protein
MRVIPIGWFADLPHGDKDEGDQLAQRMNELLDSTRTQIADYLDHGNVLAETLGTITHDVLDPNAEPIGPLRTLTDGVLVWPSDLSYYVRRYGVGLPREATDVMRSHHWTVPALSPEQLDAVEDGLTQAQE